MYAPKSGTIDVGLPQMFSKGQKVSATNKGHTISFGVSQNKKVSLNKPAAVIKDVEDLPSNKLTKKAVVNQKSVSAVGSVDSESEITAYNNEFMNVENQTGAVVYEDIFNNSDLEYIVTTNSIKENIVVNEKQNEYIYSFDMDFGELVPIVNEDNSIRLVDPEDTEETIFYIEAPYMYDANKVQSEDIDMSLTEKDGIYILTLKANADWINSEVRAFPVIIDPIIYLSFDDVFVMNGIPYKNTTRVSKELRVGRNLSNLTRTYIKPTLPTNIPEGSYISGAHLTLTLDSYYKAPSASDIYIRAYDCYDVNTWNPSSITWENQPFNNSDNGYSNGHSYLSSILASSSNTNYIFSITSAVKRWLDGGVNNGIMLASSNESTKTQVDFHSSRALDSNNYPEVYISYTLPSINISEWETDSQANETSLFITTGADWTATSDSDWISLRATSGSDFYSNKIIVSENTSVEERTGIVTVKMGNTVIGTVNVTQYGSDPYLLLNKTELNFAAGNDKKTIGIESNTHWSFTELPDWLTATPAEGSGNGTVEIKSNYNGAKAVREGNVAVTADTVTKTLSVNQTYDIISPSAPDIYEESGFVYISSRSFDFDEETESPEHIEYKLSENGEWTDYDELLEVVRTCDVTIFARVCDDAGNESPIASFTLENTLGEYTASYTDITFGEGLFPVPFARTYSSKNDWFFTFEANIKPFTNGYVFTDFYGEKQYFIQNDEGKYLSSDEDELTVNRNEDEEIASYVLSYGDMTCTFRDNGKLINVKTDYLDVAYAWGENSLTVDNCAVVNFENGKPTKITVTKTDSEGADCIKEVEYNWSEGNLTKFIDAADIEHNYAYTNELLSNNDGEIIDYSNSGRVKKIAQPNGAFVKYTYNDTAESEDAETPTNIGAVTVSDSRGVTDTWYYADGIYISNTLYGYGDNVAYDDDIANISPALTADTISDVFYAPAYAQVESDTEDESEVTEEDNIEETGTEETEETITETPLYEELDENNYVFYAYDEQSRVTAKLKVLKANITIDENTTFASAEAVAQSKESYSYDSDGMLLVYSVSERVGDSLMTAYSEEYEYNNFGLIMQKTVVTCTNTQNEESNSIETVSTTNVSNYAYDVWNQLVTTTETTYNGDTIVKTVVASAVYDALGRTISVTEDGKITAYTYDDKDNVLTVTDDGEVTVCTYSDNGDLLSITDPDSSTANYSYDDYGNLTGHNFNGYFFTYNTLGSITSAKMGSQTLVDYEYSGIEQSVTTAAYGNGQTLNYTYTDKGEIDDIIIDGETKFDYSYHQTTNEDNTTTEWTELENYVNSLKKVFEEDIVTVNDLNDNFIYSVKSVLKDEADEDSFNGRIETVARNNGQTVYRSKFEENRDFFTADSYNLLFRTLSYDDNGALISETSDYVSTEYGYNQSGYVSSLSNSSCDISEDYSYAYDDNDRLINVSNNREYRLGTDPTQQSFIETAYSYDDKGELVSSENDSYKWSYGYDERGNITSKRKLLKTVDEDNQVSYTEVESYNYVYSEDYPDELVSFNNQPIEYDASGNPTSYRGHNLSWTMGRQLVSFNGVTYTYDENAVRTSKTSNGVTTKFYLDGTRIIEQKIGSTPMHFIYDRNDELIGFEYAGMMYYYVKNLQGDITAIVDNEFFLVCRYEYDDWGKCTIYSSEFDYNDIGSLNPFRWRSYYYDTESGLYYLQSRYYDPETGRFINADDVNYIGVSGTKVGYNPFAYCENEPVNSCDPEGNSLTSIFISLRSILSVLTRKNEVTAITCPKMEWVETTRTMIYNKGTTTLVLKTPKTFMSTRKIYLPLTVANMLKERKKQIEEAKKIYGDEYDDHNLVFCHPTGKPMEGQVINRALQKLIADHNLPKVVFHSFRHASITYKLKWNGGDMKSVQGDSGHSRMDMVAEVYSHIIDEDRRFNAQKFEEQFYQTKGLRNVEEGQTVPMPSFSSATELKKNEASETEELVTKLLNNPEALSLLKAIANKL